MVTFNITATIKIVHFNSKFGFASTNSNTEFIALITIKLDYSVKISEAFRIVFQFASSNFEWNSKLHISFLRFWKVVQQPKAIFSLLLPTNFF